MAPLSAVLVLAISVVSQGDAWGTLSPGAFGCGTPESPVSTSLEQPAKECFAAVEPPATGADWKHRTFEGFSASDHGFTAAEFFLEPEEPASAPWTALEDELSVTTAHLYVSLRTGPGQAAKWYQLRWRPDPALADAPFPVTMHAFGKDPVSEPADAAAGLPTLADPLDEWLLIRPATPDFRLPLFTIYFTHNERGANAGGAVDDKLLIDLRGTPPTVRATVGCSYWEGGACTALDSANVHVQSTSCTWESGPGDFLCTATGGPFGGTYNALNARREFLLLAGREPSSLTWAPEALPSIQAFAAAGTHQGERRLVRGAGYVDVVWESDTLLSGRTVALFASPGSGEMLNTRLTLAVIAPDGGGEVSTVAKWVLGGEQDEVEAPVGYTPTDTNLSTVAVELAHAEGLRVLKVVTRRDLGRGASNRVVYLVGLQNNRGTLVGNAVRLASDASTYKGCGLDAVDPTAIAFSWVSADAGARVRVQSEEASPDFNPDGPSPCVWEGRLRWVSGTGFSVRKIRDLCSVKARDVVIDDRGSISSRPRERQP